MLGKKIKKNKIKVKIKIDFKLINYFYILFQIHFVYFYSYI